VVGISHRVRPASLRRPEGHNTYSILVIHTSLGSVKEFDRGAVGNLRDRFTVTASGAANAARAGLGALSVVAETSRLATECRAQATEAGENAQLAGPV
jgi:hypothetical protein